MKKSLIAPQAGGSDYWTPERMKNARPRPLPESATPARPLKEAAPADNDESRSGPGKPPTAKVKPDLTNFLFEPGPEGDGFGGGGVAPQNVGTQGAQFSSSRVFPDAATTAYPYAAVGKVFFTEPGVGDFICSAAVQRPRVVTTAGHCVHSGNGSQAGFFTNFRFVPSYRNGVAPYGSWSPAFIVVTRTWFSGGGRVPNAADYAMFEMADRNGQKIGAVTGYLGYLTNRLNPNHAHLIGYPANLDRGERMHQVTAESFASGGSNTIIYGSDMTGGSSGGPWVQNFGVVATGQTAGRNQQANALVGVTSYGPTASTPLYQGSSIPDSRFVAVLNAVCGHRAGNC